MYEHSCLGSQPTSVSSQLTVNSLSSQMQNLGTHAHRMDPELLIKRRRSTQDYIIQILQRKSYNPNSEYMQRISELARRLEERIYKDSLLQGEDYINMPSTAIEQRLQGITKVFNNTQQSHYISPSAVSTMIPTPGMPNLGNKSSVVSQGNTMISASAGSMVTQAAVNMGNTIANANGSVGNSQIDSFNVSTGTILNGYQQSPANIVHNSGGSNMLSSMGMMRQSNQMIPTPGLNNQQSICLNSESSSGLGLSSMDSSMVSQQQTKQYVGNHNNHMLHGLGMGVGVRSNIQNKPSTYNSPNGVMNGATGSLIGSNMQHANGPTAPEGYLCPVPYGVSPKPLQQNLDKQQLQTFVPTSMSQQMLPLVGDGYDMSASDLSGSGNIYGPGSTALLSGIRQSLNPEVNFKSKANLGMLAHHTSLLSMQRTPHLKPQKLDGSQSMNFQTTKSTQEQQMQKFHHQQFQQPNKPNAQLVQQPRYQHNQQLHQLMPNTDNLRQSSLPSNFTGKLLQEVGIESNNDSFLPQANEQFHLSELQNQYQQNSSSGNLSKVTQLLGQIQGPQNFQSLPSHVSQQILQAEAQTADSQNELSCLFARSQTDVCPQEHWNPQSQQKSQIHENLAFDPHVRGEFLHRVVGKDESQQPVISPDAHTSVACASQLQSNRELYEPLNPNRERDYFNQKRWLLLLLHSRKCPFPKGKCKEVNCITVQQLWGHMERCESNNCLFPRCSQSKKLLNHYSTCNADCPVCNQVREFVVSARASNYRPSDSGLANKINGSSKNVKSLGLDKVVRKTCSALSETSDCEQSFSKRMKVEHLPTLIPKTESALVSVPPTNKIEPPQETRFYNHEQVVAGLPCKSEVFEVKMDTSLAYGQIPISGSQVDDMRNKALPAKTATESSRKESEGYTKKEMHPLEKENSHAKMESNQDATVPPIDPTSISKSGKPKIKGVSMTELFTPEQIREHITSLRQWVGQSKAKAEKNQAMERSMSENSCQLCAVEKLIFEPPPLYCTACGARIKRNAMFYTMGTGGDTRHYFCIPCYNEARGDTIEAEGSTFPKEKLGKKKIEQDYEEWWVQCDKCEAWQHQICALFNGKMNDGGQAEYTCPNCYIEEIEIGERKPLPQSAVLGAKDLPRTILSDHIEHRLFRKLKHERQERARHFGKSVDEVPGAESLVVRVVSSVDKKLEVKQRFLEVFHEENYPSEFPYKSKVILLFQKIEGVEVCLFGMYVQEFGSECQFPNQRRVYLSYLDSVKYFRPEIRTVTGEALRTFVYHEILIGYLDYCKKRGFTSCYIWACPPLKGEDYILYCHPEIQKTPKSDKLREWYLSMLRKAAKENIAVGLTNLFDYFFVSTGECKAKVTAARLPYFDGDYWPGAAEDMITQLQQEDGRKQLKKGKTKITITKRALKAAGHTDLGCNASKDALLMQKLGETISPMKEDFIMVHLQHACAHCCILMASGNRWVCNQCKNFQICDRCYEAEQKLDDRDRHPVNSRERHDLYPIEIIDVPADTKDNDEIVESEFFDTRQAFLSLCQGNHYQYDTLRRAKHSSMMVLYHLHNPTAPAFVTSCNVCQHDIETGQGWRCEVCPDFDVCNACYQKDGCVDHPHKLTNHPSNADRDAQSQEARQERVDQHRKMLDLLVHASQCPFPHCQYPNCRRVKGLFRHGINCRIRALGGCILCKKMWYLLHLHARDCKESQCLVPRCKDLKEYFKRLQQQSESRRRAAVMEMMRQRAAELQGTDN